LIRYMNLMSTADRLIWTYVQYWTSLHWIFSS